MIELPPLITVNPSRNGVVMSYKQLAFVDSVEARERILLARIAELEADAERYRWLRDEAQYADDGLPYVITWKRGRSVGEQEILAEEELDAAIDAARKA